MAEPIEPASSANSGRREDAPAAGPAAKPKSAFAGPGGGSAPHPDDHAASGNEAESRREAAALESGAAGRAAATTHIAWPRLSRADDFVARHLPAPARLPPGPSSQWLIWVVAQVGGFALLLGGFFLGQAWSPAPRPGNSTAPAGPGYEAKGAQRAGSEPALEAADRALAAERLGDFRTARSIYEEMLKRQVPMPGAEYRLALLSLHQGDYAQTTVHLLRSVRAGDDVADCALLRASLAGMNGDYADASTQLAAAVRAQPFSAKFCFCWGESLRRAGKVPEAIAHLTEALDRPGNDPGRELCLFKLRLAKIECGDEAFNAELAGHFQQRAVGGDWLLLSAAQNLGRRDFAAATVLLEQAKAALPRPVYSVYVQDYLFQAHADRPELISVLNVSPASTSTPPDAPLQDPAAWTAAEADPAVWPPFPKAP